MLDKRPTRCHKVPHDSKSKAQASLRHAKVSGLTRGTVSVYRCPICSAWHWGHAPGKNTRTNVRGWR